jgi:hypothetical protein
MTAANEPEIARSFGAGCDADQIADIDLNLNVYDNLDIVVTADDSPDMLGIQKLRYHAVELLVGIVAMLTKVT